MSSYVLGQSNQAEYRLELLNELTSSRFVEALGKLNTRNVKVLNIGCGSGHLELAFSKVFTDSHFLGIDISEMRIQEARLRVEALKTSNVFEFIQADLSTVENLKVCDILISRFVLSHLPNPLQLLKRFIPLVKQGGLVCFEELASDGSELYFLSMRIASATGILLPKWP